MSYLSKVVNTLNYYNTLVNQTLLQNKIDSSKIGGADSAKTIQQMNSLGSALTSLAGLLGVANQSSGQDVSGVTDETLKYTMDKLAEAGADKNSMTSVLSKVLSGKDEDLLYTRTNSDDPFLTLDNRMKVTGADLNSLLSQSTRLSTRGDDLNKYYETVNNVIDKADYDDLKRFISVTNTVMSHAQSPSDLQKYYDFTNNILDKSSYDMESNIFSLQTLQSYGLGLDDSIKVMNNMETTGLEGRNNLVDLNRVIVDAKQKGAYVPYLLNQMAESGDTRAFMDQYMQEYGLKSTAPDFSKFERIERIDGEDMVITEGDSAALFAQAISSTDGLLPESVLYWSSTQTGAISNGSSYLDLSQLKAGTYDIYVKIGNYAGGTDTAKKRVIVQGAVIVDGGGTTTPTTPTEPTTPTTPTEPTTPTTPTNPITITQPGQLKITVEKGSAGLSSDLYVVKNGGSENLVTQSAQTGEGVTLNEEYNEGDSFDFFIRTNAESWNLGVYDHGTNQADSPTGKAYYTKEQIGENSWRISFEDLPEGRADWDYNDVVIKIDLVPPTTTTITPTEDSSTTTETDKTKSNNGLGDTKDADNTVKGEDSSNPGQNKTSASGGASSEQTATINTSTTTSTTNNTQTTTTSTTTTVVNSDNTVTTFTTIQQSVTNLPNALNENRPEEANSLVNYTTSNIDKFVSRLEDSKKINENELSDTVRLGLDRIFNPTNTDYLNLVNNLKNNVASNKESADTLFILKSFQNILNQIYNYGK